MLHIFSDYLQSGLCILGENLDLDLYLENFDNSGTLLSISAISITY